MKKILVIFYQFIIENNFSNLICYYESLVNELKRAGNIVKIFNTACLDPNDKEQHLKLIDEIKKFNPDLIIAFNNQVSNAIIENTSCPIALFDADSIHFFNNTDLIKNNLDRYYMISFYEGFYNYSANLGFKKDRICYLHQATNIKNENLPKNTNISFIGSNFNYHSNRKKIIHSITTDQDRKLYQALIKYWNDSDLDYEQFFNQFSLNENFLMTESYCFFDNRNYILTSILDLGLDLYGVNWDKLEHFNYPLLSCYKKKQVFSLKDNQDIYNSSKINLSISHPQTNGYAFPWRIYDIMASSGLLITSRADLLNKLTKGIVNIPMYSSPYEARDLCKKYLTEDNLREDIIAASNEFIEKHGRWFDNFKTLQSFFNIKLIQEDVVSPDWSFISFKNEIQPTEKNFLSMEKELRSTEKVFRKTKQKSPTIKNIINAIILILINIPFLGKLVPQVYIQKLYRSIEKYKIV